MSTLSVGASADQTILSRLTSIQDRIKAMKTVHARQMVELKQENATVQDLADTAFREAANNQYLVKGTSDGTVTLQLNSGKLKVKVSKKVTWNDDALRQISQEIDSDDFDRLFTLHLSVSETVYRQLPSGELKDRLTEARKVELSRPVYVFEPDGK